MKLALNIKSLFQNKPRRNQHFVFVEAPSKIVGPEIISWGEATWWPKRCSMRFLKQTPGEIKVGTRYQQKVLMLFGPRWNVEVTKFVADKEIERTFLDGILIGAEQVTIEERLNGTRVDYVMNYSIRGFAKKMLWRFFFERMHDRNIEMILAALNNFCIEKYNKETQQ